MKCKIFHWSEHILILIMIPRELVNIYRSNIYVHHKVSEIKFIFQQYNNDYRGSVDWPMHHILFVLYKHALKCVSQNTVVYQELHKRVEAVFRYTKQKGWQKLSNETNYIIMIPQEYSLNIKLHLVNDFSMYKHIRLF